MEKYLFSKYDITGYGKKVVGWKDCFKFKLDDGMFDIVKQLLRGKNYLYIHFSF